MKSQKILLIATSTLLAFLTFYSVATADPFQNGSFESGTNGWTIVNSGGVDVVRSVEGATDGVLSYNFNAFAVNGNAILSQTFDTTLGQTYSLIFDVGCYGLTTGYTQQLQIDVRNGTSAISGTEIINPNSVSATVGANTGFSFSQNGSLLGVTDTTGASPNNMAYFSAVPTTPEFSTISVNFTALSGSSTLVFSDLTGLGGVYTDAVLDNIKIVPVPEPSTIYLNLVGIIAFLCRRKFGTNNL